MKTKLMLAPGVGFNVEAHEYFLDGKFLSGVTGVISKRMGRKMPEDFVGEARNEGLHIHSTIENWLSGKGFESIHPGALWIKESLSQTWAEPERQCHAEVLVSDLKQYASSVDIVGIDDATKELVIYDIKRSFQRIYVSWQLSIYKYFIENYTKHRVAACHCIAVRDKTVYPVFPYSVKEVEGLLYHGLPEKL